MAIENEPNTPSSEEGAFTVEVALDDFGPASAEETPDTPDVDTPHKTPEERAPVPGTDEEPDEDMGQRAQRRIRGLVSDRKALEAALAAQQRELAAAKAKLADASKRGSQYEEQSLAEAEARVASELEVAKREYRDARESGDYDKEAEAMARISAAETQRVAMAARKRIMEQSKTKEPEPQDQSEPEPKIPVVQRPAPQIDERTQKWVEKNPWINSVKDPASPPEDQEMSKLAGRLHIYATQVEGLSPIEDADEYWNLIDQGVRRRFPHRFKEDAVPEKKPVKQTVTGQRQPVNTPRKVQVTLSARELEFARKYNIDPEKMAREKALIAQRGGSR